LLRAAVARQAAETGETLVELAQRLFGSSHGADLDIPPRGTAPPSAPPGFAEADADR
jgi:hypothetical protein